MGPLLPLCARAGWAWTDCMDKPVSAKRDTNVAGTSAAGVETLRDFFQALPAGI